MAQELQNTSPADIDRLRQLLCARPVLRAENAAAYDEVLARLAQCMAPRDFVEQTLIKELADCTWELARYTRYKTLTMERGFREHLSFPGQDALAERLAERDGEPDEAEAIAVELDCVRALQATMGIHERIDKLLIAATARRNNALEQIERYRNVVDYRLRVASDKFIEAEFKAASGEPRQVAAPLVPSEAQQ
jgi:hypothetical protein